MLIDLVVLFIGVFIGLMLHEPIMRREAAMRGKVRVVQERDPHRRRLTTVPPRDDTAA